MEKKEQPKVKDQYRSISLETGLILKQVVININYKETGATQIVFSGKPLFKNLNLPPENQQDMMAIINGTDKDLDVLVEYFHKRFNTEVALTDIDMEARNKKNEINKEEKK